MGRLYEALDDPLRRWIEAQCLFFVATAPDDPGGHVNLSPKGATGGFRILGPTTVAYVDLVGSGIETVTHLRENGRIVLMFCAFEGPPKIVRLHGRGRVVTAQEPEFAGLLAGFPLGDEVRPLARAVVVVEVGRVADSCGFGVPRMDFVGDRDQLVRWAQVQREKRGDGWMAHYVRAKQRREHRRARGPGRAGCTDRRRGGRPLERRQRALTLGRPGKPQARRLLSRYGKTGTHRSAV